MLLNKTEQALMQDVLDSKSIKRIKERFIEACVNSTGNPNFKNRQIAAKSQFNRDSWQIDDRFGRIQITKTDKSCRITAWFFMTGPVSIIINNQEYEEMKKVYLSDFPVDHKYINSLK